jgi:two-component system nitrogen regulation response regulator GlnG
VDDDSSIRWVLERALSQAGITNESFADADQLLARIASEQPDVIITDIRMPGTDGLELLSRINGAHPDLPVIITTAHSDLDSAVASYQQGAFEYLPKPFDLDEVVAITERALAHTLEKRGVAPVLEELPDTEIIGEAPAMQEVFRAIGRLAHSNITVLINGESGTGKELVARALHRHSPRATNPFIALNMAAIPKDLMESELFGHEKGAFTGANSKRQGRFEQANGGSSTGWGDIPRLQSMCALSPLPTVTWKNWWDWANSARIYSTASTSFVSTFLNSLNDARTYPS